MRVAQVVVVVGQAGSTSQPEAAELLQANHNTCTTKDRANTEFVKSSCSKLGGAEGAHQRPIRRVPLPSRQRRVGGRPTPHQSFAASEAALQPQRVSLEIQCGYGSWPCYFQDSTLRSPGQAFSISYFGVKEITSGRSICEPYRQQIKRPLPWDPAMHRITAAT